MYIKSKSQRLFGGNDIVPMKVTDSLLREAEQATHWQPINFIAVCTL